MTITKSHSREDRLLTNVSQKRKAEGTIHEDVLTLAQTVKSSGKIGKYGTDNLRLEHDIVGGETTYPRINVTPKSSDTFLIEKHGLSLVVTEEMYDNEEQPFDAEKDATDDVTDRILLGKEFAFASPLTTVGTITQNVTLSGTDQYTDYSSSDPLGDFSIARRAIFTGSGQIVENPNGFAIVPWQVADVLRFHPALLALSQYVADKSAGLTNEQLRKALGVGRLMIPWCFYDSSKEGQTANIIPIWGDDIVMGYSPKQGSKRIKTLGFRVQRKAPRRVFKSMQDEPPNSKLIQVDDSYDVLLTDVTCAYLIKDAI